MALRDVRGIEGVSVTPTLTICDLCDRKMAALPGPMRRCGRPEPPAGHQAGYIVEMADRAFAICRDCLAKVMQTAA